MRLTPVVTMHDLRHFTAAVLLAASAGCSKDSREPPTRVTVAVFPNVPSSLSNLVLSINIHEPSDLSVTNWKGVAISGRRSLASPFGSTSDSAGHYQEDRLIAIRADGFQVLFTKKDGADTQTNAVLFPYGETTDTNLFGWRIVGKFK